MAGGFSARSRFRRAFTRSPSAVRSSWLDLRTAAASTRRSSSAVFVAAASTVVDDLIPYGLAVGNRATLRGLNLVGLRRAGAPRDEQRALLRGFRYLFGLRPSGLAPPLPLPPLAEIKARAALLRDHDAAAAAPRLAEVCEFVLGDRGPGHAFERALCWPERGAAPI